VYSYVIIETLNMTEKPIENNNNPANQLGQPAAEEQLMQKKKSLSKIKSKSK